MTEPALGATMAAPPTAWPRLPPLAAHGIFLLLVVLNAVRLYRHVMWRDEADAFLIALNVGGPVQLFNELHYEGHPGLWHMVLWCLTRFTADPAAMQVLQFAIGLGLWLMVYRGSPFSLAEKFLLLLGYYLFFEYFIVSRGYGLMALLMFGFVILRRARPQDVVLPWLMLGLMANAELFAAIWSMALAPFLALEQRSQPRRLVIGAAVYLGLLALAVATLHPAPDAIPPRGYGAVSPVFAFSTDRLASLVATVAKALVPIDTGWLSQLVSAGTLTWPRFFNISPTAIFADLPGIAVVLALGAAAIAGGGIAMPYVTGKRPVAFSAALAKLALGWFGVLLFLYLYHVPVGTRHAGILFLMLVAAVWKFRDDHRGRAAPWWIALLVLNALGGLYTLRSEFVPFSDSRAVADWIGENRLNQAFLVAYADPKGSPVAAYLRRQIYGIECQCNITYVVWNVSRQRLDDDEILRRTSDAMTGAGSPDAILLLAGLHLEKVDRGDPTPGLAVTLLKRFPEAEVRDETYSIYRIAVADQGGPAPPP